jgi:CDP-glucose 4,6-dehydratase
VFLTGAAGLLGSWVAEILTDAGANVVLLIRDHTPKSRLYEKGIIDRATTVQGEVEDHRLLERVLNEYQIDTVFHLAAQTIVSIANQSPLSTFETNIRGTWNLLEACRTTSWVNRVVVASSDKAYGEHKNLPYSEDSELLGKYPYDVSKTCADLISQAFASSYGLPVCVTRFGNLFGPGDRNFNRLIPGTIRSILRDEPPVIRSNGKFSRDYIYVEDAAWAYMLLAEKMVDGDDLTGQAFNFSYERPMTALEVVESILSLMDRQDLQPQILGTSTNEIPHQYLSSGKAADVLDWHPEFNFEKGLDRTIPWYRELLR